jgi:urea transport system permease protein
MSMTRILQLLMVTYFSIGLVIPAHASTEFSDLLSRNAELIRKSSSKTIDPVLNEIQNFGGQQAVRFLTKWKDKKIFFIKETGQFVLTVPAGTDHEGRKILTITDIVTNAELGTVPAKTVKQIKPNSGVRAKIASTMVPFQLASADAEIRATALKAIYRDIYPSHLEPLKQAIAAETQVDLKGRMEKAYIFGVIAHGTSPHEIVRAIYSLEGDLSLEARAALNPLLNSRIYVAETLPKAGNIARVILPELSVKRADGTAMKRVMMTGRAPELTLGDAYELLEEEELVPIFISADRRDRALVAHAKNGHIGDWTVSSLNTEHARNGAYDYLVQTENLPPRIDQKSTRNTVSQYVFYALYDQSSNAVTDAARDVLSGVNNKVMFFTLLDLVLDGLSLASIYFLAAIGLAITFGVMRVINMAHGEFIMMGAYTGYIVQLVIPSYTLSIMIALPAAFLVTFGAGVLMERLVIRHLYKRPLETLLATFGISIALQQIAKNIFGTQARPLTSPSWLDGAMVINDVLAISNIRIAIFFLSLMFLALLLYVMTRTRFGLETRAVTQNPVMASSMGINPDRINMLTFGFGSGIAGIAGVAIGLFSKVTSELGSDYIVRSFMTVVVGGVGNIWGTLAGAAMIGSLQKGIEWFNPSNTLAAQTYMIIFVILFIQFRPRGIVALRGRAADD